MLGGSGNNRTLSVTAAAGKKGTATLTLNLSDGTVTVPFVVTVIVGSAKNETLNGTLGTDMIFGLGGKNTINANAGTDLLCGGNAIDTLSSGAGNDPSIRSTTAARLLGVGRSGARARPRRQRVRTAPARSARRA